MATTDDRVAAGAAVYNDWILRFYDLWVVRIANRFAWQCPADRLLDLYDGNLGRRHLDVGPGTGWYLAHARFPVADPAITLLDYNSGVVEYARRRLNRPGVRTTVASVLDPIPDSPGQPYDSIGLNYVLHCLPGNIAEKGVAFRHLADVLTDDGVLFGSTLLGKDRPRKNLFGRQLERRLRDQRVFDNAADDRPGLAAALRAAFNDVWLEDVGHATLFTAWSPRRATRETSADQAR